MTPGEYSGVLSKWGCECLIEVFFKLDDYSIRVYILIFIRFYQCMHIAMYLFILHVFVLKNTW